MFPSNSNFGIQPYVDASERQDRYMRKDSNDALITPPSNLREFKPTIAPGARRQVKHNTITTIYLSTQAFPFCRKELLTLHTRAGRPWVPPILLPRTQCLDRILCPINPNHGYPEYPANSTTNANDYYSSGPSYTHSMPPELYYSQETHQNGWANGSQEPVARSQIATEAVLDASERRRTHPHKYWCQHCRTGFTAKHNLDRHESAHNNEKKFTCELCPSSFTTKADLKRHMEKSKKHSQLPSRLY
ncbi:hypothetical protein ONZ45_g6098 [Pleurotus djamor]|nr:hypothetical protein ONZ45_g6098 [Pleurotus djamor]